MSNNKMIDYIDVYKGIGIFLMLVAHVSFWGKIDHFIHAFHMPMFFFVSGFLYRKKDTPILRVIAGKARALLLPYFVWGIIASVICLLVYGKEKMLQNIEHLIYINNTGLVLNNALWFLTAIFLAEVIFFILDRCLPAYIKIAVVIALVIIGSCAKIVFPFTLPWSLSAAFAGVGVYFAGTCARKYSENLFNAPVYVYAIAAIIVIGLIFINGELNMRTESYAIIPISLFDSVAMSGIILIFCSKIDMLNLKLLAFFRKIGENSIIYLCTHQLVQSLLNAFFDNMDMNKHLRKLIVFVLLVVLMYAISEAVSGTRLMVLFGRKYASKEIYEK